jgi:predicted MFS family arabinose efflux permease
MNFIKNVRLERKERKILFSSFAAISGVGLLSYAALPYLIGTTMISLGLTEESVGFLYGLEFMAAAISSIFVAPKIGELDRKKIAFIGAIIVIAGNLVSGCWSDYEFLLIIRPVTGIGAGLTLASGNATIANAKNPATIAGMMNVLFTALIVLLMLYLSYLGDRWNVQGVYFGLAAVTFCFLFFLILMPRRSAHADSESDDKIYHNEIISVSGISILVVFFMFTLRDSMAWGFAERIGNEVGYSPSEVGQILSIQAFVGLIGPILTAVIGFRLGVKYPLLLGVVFAGLTSYAVFLSPKLPYLFEGAVLVWTAGYFFAISYLTAYAATLDVDGRIVAASGSAMVLGVAAGPALSGYLITNGGYDLAAWATLVLVVSMIIATIISLKWRIETQEE